MKHNSRALAATLREFLEGQVDSVCVNTHRVTSLASMENETFHALVVLKEAIKNDRIGRFVFYRHGFDRPPLTDTNSRNIHEVDSPFAAKASRLNTIVFHQHNELEIAYSNNRTGNCK